MNSSEWLDARKDELIERLTELCSIRSVQDEPCALTDEEGKPAESAPFGRGVHEALQYALRMGEKDGFESFNDENYGGHLEWRPEGYEGDDYFAVIGHLDVVPEGNGWTREPYKPSIEGGRLYARGSIDDKGPLMAAYYAARSLKETGFKPKLPLRIILGADEETGWKGIEHYFRKQKAPVAGFTPDADFPVIQGEMGLLIFEIAKKLSPAQAEGLELRSIKGGSAPNMVADRARAVIREKTLPAGGKKKKKSAASEKKNSGTFDRIKELAKLYREEKGYALSVKGVGKNLEIVASGKTAHGAMPWEGVNAISILMDFLSGINFVNEDANEFIDFYVRHIGFDFHGERLGCAFEDKASGKLILNTGMVSMDENAASLTINIRFPVTLGSEKADAPAEELIVDGTDASGFEAVYAGIQPILDSYDMGLVRLKEHPPIYMPESSRLVSELMAAYRDVTGDEEAKPLTIGGGTYARSTQNVLGFGMVFPGREAVEHQADEYVELEDIWKASKVYAEALKRLLSEEAPEA